MENQDALDALKAAREARQKAPSSAKAESLTLAAEAKVARAKKSLEAARNSVAESAEENPEEGEETQAEDQIRRKIDEAAALGDSQAVERYEKLLAQFTNVTEAADSAAEGATGTGDESETGPEETHSQDAENSESKYHHKVVNFAKLKNTPLFLKM